MRQATDPIEAPTGPAPIRNGTVIGGRFRIESQLGKEGGSGVYRSTDAQSGTAYALRVIPFGAIVHGVERLHAEVEKTQALRHKNLVDVEAVGLEGDFLYVASELVDGQNLREFIDAKRAEGRGVSMKGAYNLVAHVANALDYASRVVRHGALNPALIWVNRTGRVKVSGLGLASGAPSLARHGAPVGAPDTIYVAPELVSGGAPKAASDVYSLGVILYELLTGYPPSSPFRPASAVAADSPVTVDAVIERALARNPDARWATVTVLKEALQAATTGAPLPAAAAPATTAHAPTSATTAGAAPRATATAVPVAAAPVAAAANQAARPAPADRRSAKAAAPAAESPAAAPAPAAQAQQPAPAAAAVIAGPPDDGSERWLIRKDGLDFGPFTLTQIRAQIERGEILADHLVVDSESDMRCRVREFPGLGDLVKHAHRRLESMRRAQAEQRSEKSEKKKSMVTAIVVTIVVVVVAGGLGLFLLSRRDSDNSHLASRQEEAEIDNFLKGVKIGGMKASVRRGGAHHAGPGGPTSGGSADDLNNDSNFGDASKGFTEGDQTLDDDQIQNTMMANYRKLIPCLVHSPVSNMNLEFAVRGNGKVSAVKVNGQHNGPLPGCMLSRMQSFSFPKFNGSKTIASWSMSMGH